jgi:branched-subunit amino acid transport protein
MHKIVIDLYISVVLPLSVIAAILLWHSIQAYRGSDKGEGNLFLLFAAFPLALLLVFFFISGSHKVGLGLCFYQLMEFVSPVAFVYACVWAFGVVNEHEQSLPSFKPFKIVACVLAMLIATGSTLHFMHQTANAKHVLHLTDEDSDGDNGDY